MTATLTFKQRFDNFFSNIVRQPLFGCPINTDLITHCHVKLK